MKNLLLVFSFLIILGSIVSCSKKTPENIKVETIATVKDLGDPALDGCGWVIEFEVDGLLKEHKSEDLTVEFQEDNLEVKMEYIPSLETEFACMLPVEYPTIEIVSIEKN